MRSNSIGFQATTHLIIIRCHCGCNYNNKNNSQNRLSTKQMKTIIISNESRTESNTVDKILTNDFILIECTWMTNTDSEEMWIVVSFIYEYQASNYLLAI